MIIVAFPWSKFDFFKAEITEHLGGREIKIVSQSCACTREQFLKIVC